MQCMYQLHRAPSQLHWLGRQLASSFSSQADIPQSQRVCLAGTRAVLRLSGGDLTHFLQGLFTNDVEALNWRQSTPLYSAILNAQGRFLHDLFLQSQPGAVPTVLADVDREAAPDLMRLLQRFKLRAKVDIADVSSDHQVWAQFGGGAPSAAGAAADQWPVDPRLPALGQRAILTGPEAEHTGATDASDAPSASHSAAAAKAYRRWRMQHGVAEGDTEIPSGRAVPFEYNLDGLNAISFTKGCYVGQELIARTHYQGVVRKRLMPFRLQPHPEGQATLGQPIEAAGSSKRPVGKVEVLEGDLGMGVLRLQQAAAAAAGAAGAAGQAGLHVANTALQIQPHVPAWWPEQWIQGGSADAAGQ